jgi:hypothetical protein
LLVDKLTVAATIMGWRLSQPGEPHRPMCVAEEFVLELIRREAVFALELVEASEASISATRGVRQVCEDDDILDLFDMQEPADAAVALENPINQMMGKADMRIRNWFEPFFGAGKEVLHPLYLEAEEVSVDTHGTGLPLEEVKPGQPLQMDRSSSDGEFRVIVRHWDDKFVERESWDQMPSTWIYYVDARSADAALEQVREEFPEGAMRDLSMEPAESTKLGRDDLARLSFDVQRVGLPQEFSEGCSFHVVGGVIGAVERESLERLAANLRSVFPHAVVMSDGEHAYLGASVNAETHEEADAAIDEFLGAFGAAAGLEDVMTDGSSIGQGARRPHQLIEEIESFRRDG